MDTCSGCGAGLLIDDRFCGTCGRTRDSGLRSGAGGAPAASGPALEPVPAYGWQGTGPVPTGGGAVPGPPFTGAPGYAPVPAAPATNTFAIVALVVALVGLPLCFLSPAAIPFGHVALKQIGTSEAEGRQTGRPPQSGRGMAVAGLVIGYLTLTAWAIGILQIVAAV